MWRVNKYTWLSLGFALVYLLLAQAQRLLDVVPWVAWLLFVLALVDSIARTALAYRRGGRLEGWTSTVFNGLDLLLITLAISITGGIRSDLWLLYFVVVIFESMYATPRVQRLLNIYIALLYLLSTLPHQYLPHPEPMPMFARQLCTRLFFLTMISALARRISVDAQMRDLELMRLREQMATGEERARIAREIHDSLGHALVSTILRLELCARLIRREPEEAEKLLQEEIPAIRAAWNEGRDLAFHLQPWEAEVGDEPLPETLRRHIGRFAERIGLSVTLKAEEGAWRLRPATSYAVTRIVQEALTNAVRYAQATHIEVALAADGTGWLVCTITDNGKGFDLQRAHGGVGLQSMRERAESLGGKLEIASAPGQGVRVKLVLPSE
jgi:signal transduction histidine kinase